MCCGHEANACKGSLRNSSTPASHLYLTLRADAVPIMLRLIFHKNFNPGPFKLGRAQPLINVIAISWLTFCVVSGAALLPDSRCSN